MYRRCAASSSLHMAFGGGLALVRLSDSWPSKSQSQRINTETHGLRAMQIARSFSWKVLLADSASSRMSSTQSVDRALADLIGRSARII
ncbi:uncharacterized protein BDW43DRAFT_294455 [Aspergillus alliaceus]|uniref:uncharacterized protein n=1 Tax=Petromyces alliaceus TaxID=209559 RepID=UPI0012A73FB8|nr:uncharacterized protein BDW43DRAFT_294455 [Aspergillus alliaceus]KAB8227305.1 hypothetical protein BDW43DRAFT_294455 [Aspergillus alliaceus]